LVFFCDEWNKLVFSIFFFFITAEVSTENVHIQQSRKRFVCKYLSKKKIFNTHGSWKTICFISKSIYSNIGSYASIEVDDLMVFEWNSVAGS
jgi:hypothetical protein